MKSFNALLFFSVLFSTLFMDGSERGHDHKCEPTLPITRRIGIWEDRPLRREMLDVLKENNGTERTRKYFCIVEKIKALSPRDIDYQLIKEELINEASRERYREKWLKIPFIMSAVCSAGIILTPIIIAIITGNSSGEAFSYFRGMTAGSVIQLALSSAPMMTTILGAALAYNQPQLNAQGLLDVLNDQTSSHNDDQSQHATESPVLDQIEEIV